MWPVLAARRWATAMANRRAQVRLPPNLKCACWPERMKKSRPAAARGFQRNNTGCLPTARAAAAAHGRGRSLTPRALSVFGEREGMQWRSADLSITVDDDKTSVVPGVNYDVLLGQPPPFAGNDYTVTVTNNGPDTVTQFNLNFAPGAGLSWAGPPTPRVMAAWGLLPPSASTLTAGYGAG